MELAEEIEKHAQCLEGQGVKELKEKLISYARKRNEVDQNTLLRNLLRIFRKSIDGKSEPLILREEVDRVIKQIDYKSRGTGQVKQLKLK